MLRLNENANGKFDIVISDGFKSQLHGRSDKISPKHPRQSLSKKNVTKTSKGNDSQSKQSKLAVLHEDTNTTMTKTKKSSRIAARFDRTTDNKDSFSLSKNKSASFVTKSDLENLLKVVLEGSKESNEEKSEEMSALAARQQSSASKEDELLASSNLIKVLDDEGNNSKKQSNITETDTTQLPTRATELDNNLTHSIENTKPTAMRSSFAIGAPGVVTNDSHNDKATKFKLWRDELEQQINEKKLMKSLQGNSTDDKEQNVNVEDYFQSPGCSLVRTFGESSKHEPVERGRGLMSLIATDQAEIQRKKVLEHQRAVEQQVEDRRRQKQEEKERRLKEDALEEARLAKEAAELQRQFEEELRKNREKEEQVKKRAHLLQDQISKAYQSSQQLKREKRKNMLQSSITERVTNNSSTKTKDPLLSSPSQPRPVSKSIKYDEEVSVEYNAVSHGSSLERSNASSNNWGRRKSAKHDVTRSYSEPVLLTRSQESFSKWVDEDVGSAASFDENQHVYDENNKALSDEVPFYRTKSASLLLDSVTDLQETHPKKGGEQNKRYDRNKGHNVIKRQIPEVQPTRKSLSKGETKKDVKKTSSSRYAKPAELQQKTSRNTSSAASRSILDPANVDTNLVASPVDVTYPRTITNFVPNAAPTAHQERILEQLSALRKGLLAKDQEFRTRLLNMPEYEIST